MVSMEFGSGAITSAVATDVARIGAASASMDQGLLLMVDRQLDITGPFEGILGLGQLQSEYGGAGGADAGSAGSAGWDRPKKQPKKRGQTDETMLEIPGFLRSAAVDRFSICFNDGTSPGVLRLNTPKMESSIPSVGTLHWGLEFGGMSVGGVKQPTLFCEPGGSGCGAIPDSGTTVMMGPENHVRKLLVGLCDAWPRCKTAASSGEFEGQPKEEVFQRVLLMCETWLTEASATGLDEMPSIFLHLGDAKKNKTIELTPWSYIFESAMEEVEQHSKLLGNVGLSGLHELDDEPTPQYGCTPAFGASDLSMAGTGDVWIIGTPLFYEYVVSYDLSTEPPSMSFGTEACGSCGKEALLITKTTSVGGGNRQNEGRRAPRRIRGPLRVGKHVTKQGRHAKRKPEHA